MLQSHHLFAESYGWLVLHPKWVGRIQGVLFSMGVVMLGAVVLQLVIGADARSHTHEAAAQNREVAAETAVYIFQQFQDEKTRAAFAELPEQF